MPGDGAEREREGILRDLEHADAEVRRLAVERSAALPDDQCIARLLERLGDESWRVRKAAAERLAACAAREHVAHSLVRSLAEEDDAGRRNAALEALIGCGAGAVPPLLEASADANPDVRKQATDALAAIGDERATRRLMALLEDVDANVRGAAADALGGVGSSADAPALERRLEDPEPLVRLSALRALLRLEVRLPFERLEPLLRQASLRAASIELLGLCGGESADAVIIAHLGARAPAVRDAAAVALRRRLAAAGGRDRAVQARTALDLDEGTRSLAFERIAGAPLPRRLVWIELAGRIGWEPALLPLLDAARDEEARAVALEALTALGRAGEKRLLEVWPRLDAEARALACSVLASGDEPEGVARLLEALDDADPGLRIAAIDALGGRGGPDALPRLVARAELAVAGSLVADEELGGIAAAITRMLARDGLEPARRRAALAELAAGLPTASTAVRERLVGCLALAGFDDLEWVRAMLHDASPAVRRAAVTVLGGSDDPAAGELLQATCGDEAPAVRSAAVAALAERGGAPLDAALPVLARDPHPRVRAAAARAAARCGHGADAEALLAAALADEPQVILAALEALLAHGGERAARLAVPRLGHGEPEVVAMALRCIGRHGAAGDCEAILPLLAHPAWPVRAEAVEVLAERADPGAVPPLLRRLEIEQDAFVRDALLRALRRFEV